MCGYERGEGGGGGGGGGALKNSSEMVGGRVLKVIFFKGWGLGIF